MSHVTTLEWHGRTYTVEINESGFLFVGNGSGLPVVAQDRIHAVKWLTCRSLRKGKARALVAAEIERWRNLSTTKNT